MNDEDLNQQTLLRCLQGTANVRRHGTAGERPADRFERDEQDALGPLAGRLYRRLGMSPPPAPTPRCGPPYTWRSVRSAAGRRAYYGNLAGLIESLMGCRRPSRLAIRHGD